MNEFDSYFSKIFKGTYLSKRERRNWKEEMQGHLEEAVQSGIKRELNQEEASKSALASFGTVKEVRRHIVRQTYGISPNWFLASSALFLTIFMISMFVQMRAQDIIPATMKHLPTPNWVLLWNTNPFLSHLQAWLGFAVAFFMLIYTRKRTDRIALFLSLAPFYIIWFIVRIAHQFSLDAVIFAEYPIFQPLGGPELAGYLLLLVLSLASYAWTGNRKVGLAPWILSIALTIWPMLRDTVQTALWHITNNPIFWGHRYPDSYYLWWSILTILVRIIILGLFLYGCRKIDAVRLNKVHTA
ncbi:permease prefix domain 1-containing protein [Alicyclobacillus sp. SO9]|uniref:permease prefix domain 1-containing protein n=1 Tax=Alicyclobacillus sp. SO9 TaxID=2665646 RepID=UPI0018E8E3CF|nr:permease prefix domain 1-containing protein [Alicyclobacillus sp. SO9]QQE79078.1 hypothetical protein GI364_00700 [Alicyclobacillus sp. SO9]